MKTLEISQQLSLPIATAALAKSLGVEIWKVILKTKQK
jgi:hypothetical protein